MSNGLLQLESWCHSGTRSLGRSIERSIARSLYRALERSIAGSLARSPDRSLDRSLRQSLRPVEALVKCDPHKYFGRKVTFHNHHRITTAWRNFNAFRNELTNKRYPLNARIRLFNTTISTTVLYASTSWTTTRTYTGKLQRTQGRLLRLIVGTPRRHTTSAPSCNHHDATNDATAEPWPPYLQRATHIAERQLHAKPDLAPDGTTP